jgi:hypothetical protein
MITVIQTDENLDGSLFPNSRIIQLLDLIPYYATYVSFHPHPVHFFHSCPYFLPFLLMLPSYPVIQLVPAGSLKVLNRLTDYFRICSLVTSFNVLFAEQVLII